MQFLPASDHRVQRWKNGGGVTTEIAVHPQGAGLDDFDWRVSMATMSANGPFSAFPGIARTLAILDGEGIVLSGAMLGKKTLRRHSPPFAFDGGEPVSCTLLGGPTTDLNLMSRAKRYDHTMRRLTIAGTMRLKPATGTRLVLLMAGAAVIASDTETRALGSLDAVIEETGSALNLTAAEPALAFVLTITPKR